MESRDVVKYLFLSFILGVFLWIAVNFGERLPLTVIRFVEVEGDYRVEPELVEITLLVSRKLIESKLLKDVRAYVEEEDIRKGKKIVKVRIYTPIPILIEPTAVNPPYVKIKIE